MASTTGPVILSVPPHQFTDTWVFSVITNTVVSTWLFIIVLFVLVFILSRGARDTHWSFLKTTGYLIVKHLIAFFEPLLGHNIVMHKILWLVGGVFLYILGSNLFSILLEWLVGVFPMIHDFVRPINSDINTTLGLAICMILVSHGIMLKSKWVVGYIRHYVFHFHGHNISEKIISVFVGWLHLIGEVVRVLALSLRLFWNIFAGAILLAVMYWITAKIWPQWLPIGNLLMVPFYFFEMFVGFIQAMVFSLLVALYFQESSEKSHH